MSSSGIAASAALYHADGALVHNGTASAEMTVDAESSSMASFDDAGDRTGNSDGVTGVQALEQHLDGNDVTQTPSSTSASVHWPEAGPSVPGERWSTSRRNHAGPATSGGIRAYEGDDDGQAAADAGSPDSADGSVIEQLHVGQPSTHDEESVGSEKALHMRRVGSNDSSRRSVRDRNGKGKGVDRTWSSDARIQQQTTTLRSPGSGAPDAPFANLQPSGSGPGIAPPANPNKRKSDGHRDSLQSIVSSRSADNFGKRSRQASYDQRRYTITTSSASPNKYIPADPPADRAKRRARRSNTIQPLLPVGGAHASQDSSDASASSADDDTDGQPTPSGKGPKAINKTFLPASPRLGQQARVRSHLPRAASDFIASSSTSDAMRRRQTMDVPERPGRTSRSRSPSSRRSSRTMSSAVVLPVGVSAVNLDNTAYQGQSPPVDESQPLSRTPVQHPLHPIRAPHLAPASQARSSRQRSKSAMIDPTRTPHFSSVVPRTAPPGRSFSTGQLQVGGGGELQVMHGRSVSSAGPQTFEEGIPRKRPQRSKLHTVTVYTEEPGPLVGEGTVDQIAAGKRFDDEPKQESDAGMASASATTILPNSISGLLAQNEGARSEPAADDPAKETLKQLLSQIDLKDAMAYLNKAKGAGADRSDTRGQDFRLSVQNMQKGGLAARDPSRPISPRSEENRSSFDHHVSGTSYHASSAAATYAPLLPRKTGQSASGSPYHSSLDIRNSSQIDSTEDTSRPINKKHKRLSLASLVNLPSARLKRQKHYEADFAPDVAHNTVVDPISRLSPATANYISSVKWELEMRYLALFTAIDGSQPMPNLVKVARWRSARQEALQRAASHNGIFYADPRSIHDPLYKADSEQSVYDAIRLKNRRRSIWEVQPRDLIAYQTCGGAIVDQTLRQWLTSRNTLSSNSHDGSTAHRNADARPTHGRYRSSEPSLFSTSSSRPAESPGYLNDIFAGPRRQSVTALPPASTPGGRHSIGSGGGGLLSPTQSLTSPPYTSHGLMDGDVLGKWPSSLSNSSTQRLHVNPSNPTGTSAHDRFQNGLHDSTNSLRSREHGNLLGQSLNSSTQSTRARVTNRLRQLAGRDQDDNYPYTDRPVIHEHERDRQRESQGLARSYQPSDSEWHGDRVHRPALSRRSSKNSSLTNLSRILTMRKTPRAGNETDGYKSTDQEDLTDSRRGHSIVVAPAGKASSVGGVTFLNGPTDVSSADEGRTRQRKHDRMKDMITEVDESPKRSVDEETAQAPIRDLEIVDMDDDQYELMEQ